MVVRVLQGISILLITLLCSSCIRFNVDLTVNSDGTVSGNTIYAVSNCLNGFDESISPSSELDSLFDESTPGVIVKPYDQGGYEAVRYLLENVEFEQFRENGDSGELSFSRDKNKIAMSGFLDLEMKSEKNSSEDSVVDDAIVQSILSSGYIKIRVTFPAKVINTTGEISNNGSTVTWRAKIGDKFDFTTTLEIPRDNLYLSLLLGGFSIITVGAFLAFCLRQKRSVEEKRGVVSN